MIKLHLFIKYLLVYSIISLCHFCTEAVRGPKALLPWERRASSRNSRYRTISSEKGNPTSRSVTVAPKILFLVALHSVVYSIRNGEQFASAMLRCCNFVRLTCNREADPIAKLFLLFVIWHIRDSRVLLFYWYLSSIIIPRAYPFFLFRDVVITICHRLFLTGRRVPMGRGL